VAKLGVGSEEGWVVVVVVQQVVAATAAAVDWVSQQLPLLVGWHPSCTDLGSQRTIWCRSDLRLRAMQTLNLGHI
jgi:hypothetical protein